MKNKMLAFVLGVMAVASASAAQSYLATEAFVLNHIAAATNEIYETGFSTNNAALVQTIETVAPSRNKADLQLYTPIYSYSDWTWTPEDDRIGSPQFQTNSAVWQVPITGTSTYANLTAGTGDYFKNPAETTMRAWVENHDELGPYIFTREQSIAGYTPIEGDSLATESYVTNVLVVGKYVTNSADAANWELGIAGGKVVGEQTTSAIAVGHRATASGFRAISIGRATSSTGYGAVAIGNAVASNNYAIAIGSNGSDYQEGNEDATYAMDEGDIAIGQKAKAKKAGSSKIAIGYDAVATNKGSIAIGNAKSYALQSIALGQSAVSSKDRAIAVGFNTKSLGTDAIAIGKNTTAEGLYSIVVGSPYSGYGGPDTPPSSSPSAYGSVQIGAGTVTTRDTIQFHDTPLFRGNLQQDERIKLVAPIHPATLIDASTNFTAQQAIDFFTPGFTTNNATLVKVIEQTSPSPGDYMAVSNAAMNARSKTDLAVYGEIGVGNMWTLISADGSMTNVATGVYTDNGDGRGGWAFFINGENVAGTGSTAGNPYSYEIDWSGSPDIGDGGIARRLTELSPSGDFLATNLSVSNELERVRDKLDMAVYEPGYSYSAWTWAPSIAVAQPTFQSGKWYVNNYPLQKYPSIQYGLENYFTDPGLIEMAGYVQGYMNQETAFSRTRSVIDRVPSATNNIATTAMLDSLESRFPTKTSQFTNDGADGINPFVSTNQVCAIVTNNTTSWYINCEDNGGWDIAPQTSARFTLSNVKWEGSVVSFSGNGENYSIDISQSIDYLTICRDGNAYLYYSVISAECIPEGTMPNEWAVPYLGTTGGFDGSADRFSIGQANALGLAMYSDIPVDTVTHGELQYATSLEDFYADFDSPLSFWQLNPYLEGMELSYQGDYRWILSYRDTMEEYEGTSDTREMHFTFFIEVEGEERAINVTATRMLNGYVLGNYSDKVLQPALPYPTNAIPYGVIVGSPLTNYYTKSETDNAIASLAASYITMNAHGDSFSSLLALTNSAATYYSGGVIIVPSLNDYAVVLMDESHANTTWRYIYSGSQWEAQYPLAANNYNALSDRPMINSVTLTGNKTASALGLVDSQTYGQAMSEINTALGGKVDSSGDTITGELQFQSGSSDTISINGTYGRIVQMGGLSLSEINAPNNVLPKYSEVTNLVISATTLNGTNVVTFMRNYLAQGLMQYVSWSSLSNLWARGQLVPGMQYRITNYVATTSTTKSRSENHAFDIIVTADSQTSLNESARADFSAYDNYFAGNNFTHQPSNLKAWEVKYCLLNDSNRFSWADPNGFGVVYHLKDEFDNEAPYDFKSLTFIQYDDSSTNSYFYTFTYTPLGGTKSDASLWYSNMKILGSTSELPFITVRNAGANIEFGSGCQSISILRMSNVRIGRNCNSILVGNNLTYTTIGDNCSSIDLSGGANLSIGDNCTNITTSDYLTKVFIGAHCSNITINSANGLVIESNNHNLNLILEGQNVTIASGVSGIDSSGKFIDDFDHPISNARYVPKNSSTVEVP